jgi:hypothetical protein
VKIIYQTFSLAPGGLLGEPRGYRLTHETVTDEAKFFRAPAAGWFDRGNVATKCEFSVLRIFGSHRLAERFANTHRNSLPGRGTLSLILGEGADTTQVNLQQCVLVSVRPVLAGVGVDVAYEFNGGLFDSDELPVVEDDSVVKRGTISLTQGDGFKDVAFSVPFGAPPTTVNAKILTAGPGGFVIDCNPDFSTLTAAGFRVLFGATIPAAGYQLNWEADQ